MEKEVIGLELEFDGSLLLSGQAIVKIN
ncbi:hypothetical protein CFSAN001627_15773 [Clostridium botulinum CFSAN001627]|uniref:Uncharacterized protein n=1 Tax=Clostridium botulinum CFSAN001627 TaxID=1232189 RepID=M1ZW02_CLOBO|nr:hypothetical protein CFSAN001627_15773 [Clostridium botulinum CFSAN001627]